MRDALFSLAALFGDLSCKLIILILSIPPLKYVVTIVVIIYFIRIFFITLMFTGQSRQKRGLT